MKRSIVKLVLALPLLAICAGCGSSAPNDADRLDLERRVAEYVSAVNAHDAEAVAELLTADARWQIPTRKESIETSQMRAALEMDAALNTRTEIMDCTVRGLIVTCSSTEQNDWLRLLGIDRWKQPQIRFVFTEDGLIRLVKWIGKDEEAFAELRSGGMAFRSWARSDEDLKQRYQSMLDESGEQLRWDRSTAETLMSLGREWVDAGRPGLEEARAAYAERMESYEREQKAGEKAGERPPAKD